MPKPTEATALEAMQREVAFQITTLLTAAQSRINEADALLAAIPKAYQGNGLGGAITFIRGKLEEVDEKFITGYRSVHANWGKGESDESESESAGERSGVSGGDVGCADVDGLSTEEVTP